MRWSNRKYDNYHTLQWVKNDGLIGTLSQICGTGEALLELGCGTGAMIGVLAGQFTRCVGVDPASELLARAPKKPNIEYIAKPLEDLDYVQEFDCVILRNTVHHLADPEAGISQAMRALRRGGRIVLCEGVPPDSRVESFYRQLFGLFDSRHILTEGDLLALLRMNGFKQLVIQPFFMEDVDLIEWLKKVSPTEEVFETALRMHQNQDSHFRRVYEVQESDGRYIMTWRFMIATGVRP